MKVPRRSRSLGWTMRVALIAGGVLLVIAAAALLGHGDPASQTRLGRVAGILILAGVVGAAVGAVGRL